MVCPDCWTGEFNVSLACVCFFMARTKMTMKTMPIVTTATPPTTPPTMGPRLVGPLESKGSGKGFCSAAVTSSAGRPEVAAYTE